MMPQVHLLETNTLSTLRTRHRFLHYGEFTTTEEFLSFRHWAREHRLRLYILGHGSNTLFLSRTVRTLVLRNRLEPRLRWLDDHRVEAASSLPTLTLLQHCHERHLESFYYLATAPATIGGAIAMNAGRGRECHMTVFDFLESITYTQGEAVVTADADRIDREHRWTPFTGVKDRLIVSAVFQFCPGHYEGDPIAARRAQCQNGQDLSAPNCGSIFKEYHGKLQGRLRGLRIGQACFSPKTVNWILNYGQSPWSVRALIGVSKAAHRLLGKKARLELIEVP